MRSITAVLSIVLSICAVLIGTARVSHADPSVDPGPTLTDPISKESSANPQLTEILIQGAPRSTFLQTLAGSAAVINAPLIEERGSSNFQQLLDLVPGLNFSGGTARPRFFQIRGIGELEQYEGAPNPSVGVIIDDIDFSGLGVLPSLFDINQIEVLRGPQSIRYGSSALAGVIGMRSVDPSPQATGSLQGSVGNDSLRGGAAAVGGAVPGTDGRLQLRLSTSHEHADGYRKNVFLNRDDTNERNEHTTRFKARLQAADDLTFDLTAFRIDNDNGYDAFTIDNSLTTRSDRPGQDDIGASAGALKARWDISPSLSAENIFTIARSEQVYSYDGDWGNNPFWEPFTPYDFFSRTDRDRHTLSNELRILGEDPAYVHGESSTWVAGLYLRRLDEDTFINDLSEDTPYRSLSSDYRADTAALFAQSELPLVRGTSLTIGGRFEHRSSEYTDSNPAHFTPDDSMVGGNIALSHDLNRDVRLYAAVSRGFKGGGFNPGTTVPSDRRIYEPEALWNFETGLKGSADNGRLNGELAAFYGLRRNAQQKFAFQNDPADPLSFTYITDSDGRGWNGGLEATVNYALTPRWKIDAIAALLETEYSSAPEASPFLDGRGFSHAPAWQYGAGATYQWSEEWFTRLELFGKDRFYFDDSHNQRSNPYHLLGASAGYRSRQFSWIVWARNILDDRYAVRGFFFGNEPPDFPTKDYIQLGDPLSIGTTVAYHF